MPTLQFKGKTFVQTLHLTVPYQQLEPVPELSRTERPSIHDNLIVQGDNLVALKSLLPTFAQRVKCIYIDPPYNTATKTGATTIMSTARCTVSGSKRQLIVRT